VAVLDTTFLIDLMREAKKRSQAPAIRKLHVMVQQREALRVSLFTVGELFVGVTKSRQPNRERKAVEACLTPFEVIPFERSTAEIFGNLVGQLEQQGIPISDMDALIAATALELNEVLVTRNPKHFQRIPGIIIETY